MIDGFPSQRANNVELWYFVCLAQQAVEETFELPVIWDTMTLMGCHCIDWTRRKISHGLKANVRLDVLNYHIVLKFDRCLSSPTAKMSGRFQSNSRSLQVVSLPAWIFYINRQQYWKCDRILTLCANGKYINKPRWQQSWQLTSVKWLAS